MTATTKEYPILFRDWEVRATLDGRKSQTRRLIKPQPIYIPFREKLGYKNESNGIWATDVVEVDGNIYPSLSANCFTWEDNIGPPFNFPKTCPFGQPGDRLWVKETFAMGWLYTEDKDNCIYRAGVDEICDRNIRWTPSIHMPRWASRITLEITDVRVEKNKEGAWEWIINFEVLKP